MKIAIVILNWNGKKLLEQFLPSVIQYSEGADIYVADNGSTDDSVDFIKQKYPTVRVIQNTENEGYAKGYNDALRQIDADIFCLLNSDVEVTENWLSPILSTFEKESNTAIIQPKLLDQKQKNFFEYAGAAGGFIDKYGYPYCRGRIFNTVEEDKGQYNDTASVFWVSGACLFIRKAVFEELNGFDESFFAHMEEIDLCWRAINFGYDVKYVGMATVYHVGGATLKNTNPKKTYLNFRNSLFTLVKNSSGSLLPKVIIRLVLDGVVVIKFALELKPAHIYSILKAHFSFYGHLTQLLKQRKQLPQKPKYYNKKSIVWAYFVNRKRYFNGL